MHIGYARVSTQDQDLSLQYDALRQAQCDKIYEDKASGALASRDGLTLALEVLRENDSLVVWKLDRLGRSLKDLVAIVCDLEQRDVHFKCLADQIDTSTPSGRFFFHVMASLAQMERDLTVERTQAGPGGGPSARSHRGTQTQDDRFQNSCCKAVIARRRTSSESGKRSWCVDSNVISLGAGIETHGGRRQ